MLHEGEPHRVVARTPGGHETVGETVGVEVAEEDGTEVGFPARAVAGPELKGLVGEGLADEEPSAVPRRSSQTESLESAQGLLLAKKGGPPSERMALGNPYSLKAESRMERASVSFQGIPPLSGMSLHSRTRVSGMSVHQSVRDVSGPYPP